MLPTIHSRAAGLQTNLMVSVIDQAFDTNTFDFTTNYLFASAVGYGKPKVYDWRWTTQTNVLPTNITVPPSQVFWAA